MPDLHAQPRRDLDRLILTFYSLAVEDDWQDFRSHAMTTLCQWLGASGCAWLTSSQPELPGEFSQHPPGGIIKAELLTELKFDNEIRELKLDPLPLALRSRDPGERGYALQYSHRGAGLVSTVFLRFPADVNFETDEYIRRAIGHMVEAGGLALRTFIQRDEWLFALGRPNRGTAALVDAKGTVYAASRRFRELISSQIDTDAEFAVLPFSLPEPALEEGQGGFFKGALHFRVSQYGHMYLLHARRPAPLDGLSPREQQIARALGNGKTFKSVARQYDIAVSTVANHASRIYRKLGIFRREDLVELVRKPGAPPRAVATAKAR